MAHMPFCRFCRALAHLSLLPLLVNDAASRTTSPRISCLCNLRFRVLLITKSIRNYLRKVHLSTYSKEMKIIVPVTILFIKD